MPVFSISSKTSLSLVKLVELALPARKIGAPLPQVMIEIVVLGARFPALDERRHRHFQLHPLQRLQPQLPARRPLLNLRSARGPALTSVWRMTLSSPR